MKTVIISLATALLFSCQTENTTPKSRENLSLADFECLNLQADKSLTISEVNKKIYGEWQLYGLLTMLPTKEIPDLMIVLSNITASPSEKPTAQIFENGKLKGKVKFTFKEMKLEEFTSVTIESENETLPVDYYNFIKGTIRICEAELMIDNGMAFDAPAYLFRKIR